MQRVPHSSSSSSRDSLVPAGASLLLLVKEKQFVTLTVSPKEILNAVKMVIFDQEILNESLVQTEFVFELVNQK